MKTSQQIQKLEHSPNLRTVMMVEDVLKNMDESVITIPELKRKLPRQVNHNTLMEILDYLDKRNFIVVGVKGIAWTYNPSMKLKKAISEGFEYNPKKFRNFE